MLVCTLLRKAQTSVEPLLMGRHRELLARDSASGVGTLNVAIAGAAYSLTKVVITVMLIVIVEGVFVVRVGRRPG